MTKLLTVIKNLNQILLFVAALIVIAVLSYQAYKELTRTPYQPPKIELVDETDEGQEQKKQIYSLDYLNTFADVHIFELASKVIDVDTYHRKQALGLFAMADTSNTSYLSGNAVNMMFVREDGSRNVLLAKDALITSYYQTVYQVDEDYPKYRLERNLYLIIEQDTNANGFLDHKDKMSLYSSAYDGQDLRLISTDVNSIAIIGDNKVMIAQGGEQAQFTVLNVKDHTLIQLNTSIEKIRD